ncbi:protein MIS12 homolog isoform X2 [Cajanus cajan]|uniref:protein MIS12 homolog isoform X2 n=1 Tax=Cajanus cajan TaxID=3821 RepID=UPI00098D8FAA|nr:protein MIS12 homolog isoform X2 [Cajanus cajan]
MEGTESEAIFGALNLDPQLFCNEVLNSVDDILHEAFDFFYQDASAKLNIEATQRSQDLKKDESNENGLDSGAAFNPEIDAQLDSLREKLTEVGKESEVLNQEIQALERKSTVNAGFINEAVQLYEQNSMHEMFHEIMTTASELGMKMGKLNSSMIEETDQMKIKKIYSTEMDLSAINSAKGLSNLKLENLEEFASVMKSM